MGAIVLELLKFDDNNISGELIINYLMGTVVAGVVGYIYFRYDISTVFENVD